MATGGPWNIDSVVKELKELSQGPYRENMPRFGVVSNNRLGVRVPDIRKLARKIGKNHALAMELWDSGIHESRILTAMIANPEMLTESQMEKLVSEIDSWDICDNLCGELFLGSRKALGKIHQWADRPEEFVRRAAFALIAYSAVHLKTTPDEEYIPFLDLIRNASGDDRHYVRKSVDWALRQIGKRSMYLNGKARELALELKTSNERSARWIGSNSLRELESPQVKARLIRKENRS